MVKYIGMKKHLSIVAFLFLSLAPISAFAANVYNFGCANNNGQVGVTCSSDVFTFPGIAPAHTNSPASTPTWIVGAAGKTVYASFTISGAATGNFIVYVNATGLATQGRAAFTGPQTVSDFPIIVGTSSPTISISSGGASPYIFTGTVSNICITDVAGSCGMPHGLALSGGSSTPASALVALAGTVSDVWDNYYLFVAFPVGLFLSFMFAQWLIALIGRRHDGTKKQGRKL